MPRDAVVVRGRERVGSAKRREDGVDRVAARVTHHHTPVAVADARECRHAVEDRAPR